jgi:hypothetical protein
VPAQAIEPLVSSGTPYPGQLVASPGSVFNPFSEGGIFDGHTIADVTYTFLHPNEVQSGQGKQLTQSEIEALSKSTPADVPLANFHPIQDLQQTLALPTLTLPTISTGTKAMVGLVAITIIVLVLRK